ncbi:MAG: hypothetical protein FJZ95_00070, partial [Chloroflexi bacterium]|nr:hypothetical protein [Chloroflexota bacterium]
MLKRRDAGGIITAPVLLVLLLVLFLIIPPPALAAPAVGIKTPATNKILQFTSGGHVLGFTAEGILVASASHVLKTKFIDANPVTPEADASGSGSISDGMTAPLGRITYKNLWDGITLVYEAGEGAIMKSTYYVDTTGEGVPSDQIRLSYNRPVRIDEKGNLVIAFQTGAMVEAAPVAWQEIAGERKPV